MGLWYKKGVVYIQLQGQIRQAGIFVIHLSLFARSLRENPSKVSLTSKKSLVIERELLFQILSATRCLMPRFVSQASSLLKLSLSPTESWRFMKSCSSNI